MKNKGLVAVIAAAVIIGGGYAGCSYLENKVVTTVRTAITGAKDGSVGAVRFSAIDRKLIITDARATFDRSGQGMTTVSIRSGEAILPWGLLFSSDPQGSVQVAESYVVEGIEYTMPQNNATLTVARERGKDVRTDLTLTARLIAGKELSPVELSTLYERNGISRYDMESLAVKLPENMEFGIAQVMLEGVTGLKIAKMALTDVSLNGPLPDAAKPESQRLMTLASAVFTNIDLPPNALRTMFELSEKGEPSQEQLSTFMQNLFGGKQPLINRIEIKDLQIAEAVFPLSVKLFNFDWPSVQPIRYTSTLENLVIPTATVEQYTGARLPHLKAFNVSITSDVTGEASGKVTEVDTYTLEDLVSATLRTTVAFNTENGTTMPMSLWNVDNLSNASIVDCKLVVEDKNLMAYLLLNREGPEATGERLLNMMPIAPANDVDGNYKKMVESFTTFIKTPGTLTVSFNPEKPLPFAELIMVVFDPSAFLTFEATPGPLPVQETVRKLAAQ